MYQLCKLGHMLNLHHMYGCQQLMYHSNIGDMSNHLHKKNLKDIKSLQICTESILYPKIQNTLSSYHHSQGIGYQLSNMYPKNNLCIRNHFHHYTPYSLSDRANMKWSLNQRSSLGYMTSNLDLLVHYMSRNLDHTLGRLYLVRMNLH